MRKATYVSVIVLVAVGLMGGGVLLFGAAATAQAGVAPMSVAAALNAAPVSDDFNSCRLNESLWTVRDPKGDSTIRVNGQQLLISVPANSDHDLFTNKNFAPRILQDVSNEDFVIEARFQSTLDSRFQLQGIIVEQDTDNFLRMEFYHNGSDIHMFAAYFQGGTINAVADEIIAPPAGSDLYMRLSRTGNSWTQERSYDGTTWETNATFEYALQVAQAGVYGGNADPSSSGDDTSPAHTAIIDYFFNTAAPITPEDGNALMLSTAVVGNGTLTKSPDQTTYACDEPIEVTAVPEQGWFFSGWSGAATSGENPLTITLAQGTAITATFAQQQTSIYLPFVAR